MTYLDLIAQVIYTHTYYNILDILDEDEITAIENELEERLLNFKKER